MTIQLLRPKEAAKMLGLSVDTLRKMDSEGELNSVRTSGGHRRFRSDEVKELMSLREIRHTALYARVSSHDQRDDLKRQVGNLRTKYPHGVVYTDISSGLKFERKGFQRLLDEVLFNRVLKVVVVYDDRLARFGLDLLEDLFQRHGTTIEVLEDQRKSPQEELVNDLIAIVTSFSGRLYGMRSHKSKKLVEKVKEEVADEGSPCI